MCRSRASRIRLSPTGCLTSWWATCRSAALAYLTAPITAITSASTIISSPNPLIRCGRAGSSPSSPRRARWTSRTKAPGDTSRSGRNFSAQSGCPTTPSSQQPERKPLQIFSSSASGKKSCKIFRANAGSALPKMQTGCGSTPTLWSIPRWSSERSHLRPASTAGWTSPSSPTGGSSALRSQRRRRICRERSSRLANGRKSRLKQKRSKQITTSRKGALPSSAARSISASATRWKKERPRSRKTRSNVLPP